MVGVAADDVLNVRAGPSARDEIVGTLAPTATGVVVKDKRLADWWGVILDDGVEGWVNSSYLAIDDAWTAPLAALPCAQDGDVWDEVQHSPGPIEPSDATVVYGYDFETSTDCDRLVIRLAAPSNDPAAAGWPVGIAATTVPAGVEVTSESNRVTVALPDDSFEIGYGAFDADYGAAQLFAVAPIGPLGPLEVVLLYGAERIAHARFLDDPARVVVDVRPSPDPTGVDLAPRIGRLWVLTEPVRWDGRIPGTTQPITVTGFGRPYEAHGIASLSHTDGGSGEIDALWAGGFNCTNDFGAPTARGDTYCFSAAYHVWGEFAFTIDELPPGRYRLSIQDECAAGDETDCDELAMHHDFAVER